MNYFCLKYKFVFICTIICIHCISDILECDHTLDLNLCGEKDTCRDFDGGYECSCRAGKQLENDGRTCTGRFIYLTS